MLKKVILHLSGPLVALILMGCSSSNAIDFGVDSQCVYPIKGSMKYIEVSKMDGDCVFSVLFEPGDGEARKPLAIQNLQPNHIYQIRNSGGDRGPYEIFVETDSSGKGIHVMEWDELPSVFLLTQKNLNPVLKRNSLAAINGHIDEERARGNYNYPDSVLCAGIWFDFRGEADSLYVLGGPMPLYDEEFGNPEVNFIGYYEGRNCLISVASLGEQDNQTVGRFVNTADLSKDKEAYKIAVDKFMAPLSDKNVCAFLQSSYTIEPDGRLLLNKRRLRR